MSEERSLSIETTGASIDTACAPVEAIRACIGPKWQAIEAIVQSVEAF
jgi:hypothetical protein